MGSTVIILVRCTRILGKASCLCGDGTGFKPYASHLRKLGDMRISKPHRFVFISTPKAGTHSVYKMLDDHYSDGLRRLGFHRARIPRSCRSYFRWTICRNPYSRAVSLWWSACRLAHLDQYRFRKRCGAVDDFTKFITWLAGTTTGERAHEPLMMNQTEWIHRSEPVTAVHMENMVQELSQLPFWDKSIVVPQLNTTTEKIRDQAVREGCADIQRPSQHDLYLDKRARQAVMEWAGPDFDRFGYSKETV